MNLQELKEIVNKIHKNTNNLSQTGRILIDRYLILNIKKEYNTKLSKLTELKIPDLLYTQIKNITRFKKHMDSNPRDLPNKIKYDLKEQFLREDENNLILKERLIDW